MWLSRNASGKPLSSVDRLGLTEQDIHEALEFLHEKFPNHALPTYDHDGTGSVLRRGPPDWGAGHFGRTWHPRDPANPEPNVWCTKINETFWGPLDKFGLQDLLETLLHEGKHMSQPLEQWHYSKEQMDREETNFFFPTSYNDVQPYFEEFARRHSQRQGGGK